MKKYKILKYQETPNGTVVGHYVNDSEGIAVEWDDRAEAQRIADLFQTNSVHGYIYKVIQP
jgi:hypothetical protein